jgi:hypothetical protein
MDPVQGALIKPLSLLLLNIPFTAAIVATTASEYTDSALVAAPYANG